MEAFRHPESTVSLSLGERRLAILTHSNDTAQHASGSRSRTPHFILVGAPAVCGFGPVIVRDGSRVVLWSKWNTWWVVTDLGGEKGAILLVAYDNFGADGPVEIHVIQEPQVEAAQRWLSFVWMPLELSRDGFVLRPVPQPAPAILSVEVLRDGKLVSIGDIQVDSASGSISLRIETEATANRSLEASEGQRGIPVPITR
jgi:hypothetical protein